MAATVAAWNRRAVIAPEPFETGDAAPTGEIMRERDELRAQGDSLARSNVQHVANLRAAEKERDELRARCAHVEREWLKRFDTMKQDRDRLAAESAEARDAIKKLKADVEKHRNQWHEDFNTRTKLLAERDRLAARVVELESLNSLESANVEAVSEERGALRADVDRLTANLGREVQRNAELAVMLIRVLDGCENDNYWPAAANDAKAALARQEEGA